MNHFWYSKREKRLQADSKSILRLEMTRTLRTDLKTLEQVIEIWRTSELMGDLGVPREVSVKTAIALQIRGYCRYCRSSKQSEGRITVTELGRKLLSSKSEAGVHRMRYQLSKYGGWHELSQTAVSFNDSVQKIRKLQKFLDGNKPFNFERTDFFPKTWE